jgi:hypothetical protein
VNNVAINLGLLTYISSDVCLEVVLLDHMAVVFLVFVGSLHTVLHNISINLHFYQQYMRVPFAPTSLPTFVIVFVLDDSHSIWRGVES